MPRRPHGPVGTGDEVGQGRLTGTVMSGCATLRGVRSRVKRLPGDGWHGLGSGSWSPGAGTTPIGALALRGIVG